MIGVYWRAANPKPVAMALLAIVAAASVATTEVAQTTHVLPHLQEKLAAARLCSRAFDVLREERLRRGLLIDPELDPTRSGLIGALLTPVTTEAGKLVAKQTSINPNFGAVVVQMLLEAGVRPGETIAVNMTGSYPAFDVAVLAGAQTLDLKVLLFVSAGSSQWGANEVGFTWPDMLSILQQRGVFTVRPLAGSRGGVADVARGMSQASQLALDAAIDRLGIVRLGAATVEAQVNERLRLLQQASHGAPVRAFVNVGGGAVSVGAHAPRAAFRPGLNQAQREGEPMLHSLMQRFLDVQVPVINMRYAQELAQAYGLPEAPTDMPAVGEGGVFRRIGYSRQVAAGCLLALLLAMAAIFRRPEVDL